MKILEIKNKNSQKNATKILKSGGVLVFPTDTVYGIGSILNDLAIKKLYKIKNRPLNQPSAILLTEKLYNFLSSRAKSYQIDFKEIKGFRTGEVTVIMPVEYLKLDLPGILVSEAGTVGVRLPNLPWLKDLIDQVGPIVASSANKKGELTPLGFDQVSIQILEEADLVIKTTEKLAGKSSAIFDLTTGKYLRT